MSREEGSRAGEIALGFVLGAVVGAGLALLFAPASGRDTRDLLTRKAKEGQDKAADLARDAWASQRDNVLTALERGREAFQRAREKESI